MNKPNRSLWSTLLFTFLIFAIVPATVFIIFEEAVIQQAVRKELSERGRNTAKSVADGIALYLSSVLETTAYLAHSLAHSLSEQILSEQILSSQSRRARVAFRYLDALMVVKDDGIVVFTDPADLTLIGTFMGEDSGITERGILRDRLELMRQRTEEREAGLKTALIQRDILLKEVHHRVKNNLQIVSSMLSLQQEGLVDPKAVEALDESRRRVQALSLIHETLYQTSDFAEVDFGTYASHLVPEIIGFYPNCSKVEIQVEVRIGFLALPVDQAIPMGLILSELASNAAKYALQKLQGI